MTPTRIAAPSEKGILAVPELSKWLALLDRSTRKLADPEIAIGGRSLADVRIQARNDLRECCRESANESPDSFVNPTAPIFVVGHQPGLVHPGVWIKNFAVCGLARSTGGVGVHIIIDNDLYTDPVIAVPAGNREFPLMAHVPLDRGGPQLPAEERTVLDEEIFSCFAERCIRSMRDFDSSSILPEYWKHAVKAGKQSKNLCERLSIARRAIEQTMGCVNQETTLSAICDKPSFSWFAAELIARQAEFAGHYNRALAEYRRTNRIRGKAHPAPDLETIGDWVEAPFWIWSAKAPRRQRVFVRNRKDRIDIRGESEETEPLLTLPASTIEQLAKALHDEVAPWKIRPRALTATMYLRLFLADLFVHGIGGGKYDQVTDAICEAFFPAAPASFTILTATLLLPFAPPSNKEALQASQRRVRDLQWNPDRYLPESLRDLDPVAGWIERKAFLAAEAPTTHAERLTRFGEFRSLNARLGKYLGEAPLAAQRDFERQLANHDAVGALRSREFPFCLHPRESLETLVTPLLDFGKIRTSIGDC